MKKGCEFDSTKEKLAELKERLEKLRKRQIFDEKSERAIQALRKMADEDMRRKQ